MVVNPASTTTYTLTATNDEGSVMQDVIVTVAPTTVDPTISEFLAKNEEGILRMKMVRIPTGLKFTIARRLR